jgi:hypothetical protein
VDFLGDAEWYIGIKFDWKKDDNGSVSCRLSQEGYAAAIVDGFPIDANPHVEMSQEDRAPLISKIQCWLGC